MTPLCAKELLFFKVEHLAQLIKTLATYWLGAFWGEDAGSNPGGSIHLFSHVQWLLIFIPLEYITFALIWDFLGCFNLEFPRVYAHCL